MDSLMFISYQEHKNELHQVKLFFFWILLSLFMFPSKV